jgi:thiol-disulfide isomerase/thioredoxin
MTTKTKKAATKPGAKRQKGNKQTAILLVVFGVVAAALIAAIVLSSDEPIGSGGEYGEPTVAGDALPAMASGQSIVENDPANGLVAPEITGQDFDDSTVTIAPDGTPRAIVFIAHWCDHCRREVPKVQSWLDSGGGVEGVQIVSVTTSATSGQPNWPPSSWLERENWTSPNIRDDQGSSILQAYGGNSFPYWVFLNGDGTVASRIAGSIDIATLELVMQTLQPTG